MHSLKDSIKYKFVLFAITLFFIVFSNIAAVFLWHISAIVFEQNHLLSYGFIALNYLGFGLVEMFLIISIVKNQSISEDSNNTKTNPSAFTHRIAHDIRTPLAMLEVTLSSLNDRIPNEEQKILRAIHHRFGEIANNLS